MRKNILYILTLFLLFPFCAHAVPAKRGVFTVRQADGTDLRIQLRGDERHHITLSEDDCPLVEKNGVYYFAEMDNGNNIVASKVKAENVSGRSAKAQAFVEAMDKRRMLEACQTAAETAAMRRSPRHNPGLFDYSFPVKGDVKGLVVLVEYKDKKFTLSNPVDYFTRMMNQRGFSDYGGTGCVEEYFEAQSMGQFSPQFDVYGPITLSQNMSYYGGNNWAGNDQNPEKMAIEACQQLDATVDFTQYDTNNDGYIDNVFIFYAGGGEATGGGSNTVWPHSWNISEATSTVYKFDGVRLDRYACSNEWESGVPDGIGTFVHEFSHVMGLLDLYATSYTSAFTPGAWSVMDYGPYNNDGRTPPAYSVYERYALEWIEPLVLDGPLTTSLNYIGDTNEGCIVKTNKANEFFLFENRQKKGWDTYIPGHGMLVWHIDFNEDVWNSNTVNNTASHQYVDLEEANNSTSESNRAGNPFPGTSNKTSFTDDTTPSMKTWAGKKLGLPITNIKETAGVISFDVAGGYQFKNEKPQAMAATDVTYEGFTANWKAIEGAVAYTLNVAEVNYEGECKRDTCDFTGGLAKLPQGWTTNSKLTYANDQYSGQAKPALRLSTADSYICTPDYGSQVEGLRFWHRGSSVPAANSLNVCAKVNGEWLVVKTFAINNEAGGETLEVDSMPNGAVCVKIELHMEEAKGAVAIDDIVVDYGREASFDFVLTDLLVENEPDEEGVVSSEVDGLKPETTYIFNVTATDGETLSQVSDNVFVMTGAKATAIKDVWAAEGGKRILYDAQGRMVRNAAELPHGIYIIKEGNKAKAVVR